MSNLHERKKKSKKQQKSLDMSKHLLIIGIIFLAIATSSASQIFVNRKNAQETAQQLINMFDDSVSNSVLPYSQDMATSPELINTLERVDSMQANVVDSDADNVQFIDHKLNEKTTTEYEIIAKLSIEKIKLETPVISTWSYELLDVSANKFSGPEPNEPGNFVIIAHNYSYGVHFGSINLLEIGDLINLTDLSGRVITYEIYEILTIEPDEIDKLTTYEYRTLTLVTCDTNAQLRIVVKSKELSHQ